MPAPAMSSPPDLSLETFRTRLRELRERGNRASSLEVERAINDVFAAVIGLEAVRTRVSRRLQESVGRAMDPGAPERLRDYGESLAALEQDVEALRSVLDELRALPVEPVAPRVVATDRRALR